ESREGSFLIRKQSCFQRRLPNSADSVGIKHFVVTDQRHILDQCLRDEKTVKRVTMVKGQDRHSCSVFVLYEQESYIVLRQFRTELSLEIGHKLQLPDCCFDRNFPNICGAAENLSPFFANGLQSCRGELR